MKYAVGEIILVVIGILIALQINTWNDQRKAKDKTTLLLKQVQKELLYNIKRSNVTIDFYRKKNAVLYQIGNHSATYHDYMSNPEFSDLLGRFINVQLENDAYNNLIDNDSPLTVEQDSIIFRLKGLYGTDKKLVDLLDKGTYSLIGDFFVKMKNEKQWYTDWDAKKTTDQMANYFLNDPFYLNEVTHYKTYALQNHLPNTIIFKHKAMSIYKEISDHLKIPKDSLVIRSIKDYGHYIGSYQDSIHSVIIKEENNELKAYWKSNRDTTFYPITNFFPSSKTYFTTTSGLIYGELILDKNDNVIALKSSLGYKSVTLKKI